MDGSFSHSRLGTSSTGGPPSEPFRFGASSGSQKPADRRRVGAATLRIVALLAAFILVVVFLALPGREPSTGRASGPSPRLGGPSPRSGGGGPSARSNGRTSVDTAAQGPLARQRSPFDIVYMWVNGSETAYATARAKYYGMKRTGDRDRDNGELRYSLRSLDKFMPWFTGTIHFVHQNVPCWLDVDHPRLNLVHHREIFTDQANTMPTFSSDAIEAHLHRIPGLQKNFLLMNDDFFLGRMTSLSDYMLANGDPVLWFEKYTVKGTKKDHLDLMKKGKKSWLSKIYHTKSLLVDKFRVTDPAKFHFLKHSPTMLNRDRMQVLWDQFPEAVRKVTHYRQRKPDGLSMTWLHHHYCLLDRNSRCFVVPQALADKEAKFLKVGSAKTKTVRKTLKSWMPGTGSPPKFFTINDETDVGRGKHLDGKKIAFGWFLPTMYPEPSQWETRSTCVPIPRVTDEATKLALRY